MSFKRFNKYICALSLAAACTVTTMGATLTDVTSSHWAYSSIVNLEKQGVMALTSAGQFFPNQTMNYFEAADVLAKAGGYVDVDLTPNVDETFKAQIQANYEKQKPTLAAYAAKYSTWNKAYDQQVAYLLGRGYINTADLDLFMSKSGSSEVKNIITKEQLSVWLVRLLAKEETAKNAYTAAVFKDESSMKEANRPYMAYLKTIGIVSADASGNGNGTMKVTKALCAKMVDSTLQIKESSDTNAGTNSGTTSSNTYTLTKVLTKNTNEYYMCLTNSAGEAKYYSIKTSTKVLDASGNEVGITKIELGSKVTAKIETQNNTDYITSIQLTAATTPSTDSSTGTGNNTSSGTTESTSTVSGTLVSEVNSGVLRLTLTDGTTKAYVLDDNCQITLNGSAVNADKLSTGDKLVMTVKNSSVTKITATATTSSNAASNGEVTAKKLSGTGYVFTIKQNNSESSVIIPYTATITRNNKEASVQDIRVGDTIKVTKTNGIVTAAEITGQKTTVTGTLKEIHIAQASKVIVNVNNEAITYTLASDAQMYDVSSKKYINVRDLHLGQEVTLILESKEVISLDVEPTSADVKIMGTIKNVSRNSDYIDVLVDYDYMTGETKVYKRIEVTNDVSILLNGKSQKRSILEEGMEIVINYKYLDDTVPEKILIIQ